MALPAVADVFKTSIDDSLKKLVQPAGLVPAAVFVLLNVGLVYPLLLAADVSLAVQYQALDDTWKVAVVTILTLLLGYAVVALNDAVASFAAGDTWREGAIKRVLEAEERARFHAMNGQDSPPNDEHAGPRVQEGTSLEGRYKLKRAFPGSMNLRPTPLGNALAAASASLFDAYGIDLTATWPHMRETLRGKQKELLSEIDDDQVGMNTLLNLGAVLVLFAIEGLGVTVLLGRGNFVLPALGALAAAGLAYSGAVARAESWGDHVAAAYDLYRADLRTALGVGEPRTAEYEKRQWKAVSQALLWEAADRSLFLAESAPPAVALHASPSIGAALVRQSSWRQVDPGGGEIAWIAEYVVSVSTSDVEATRPAAGFVDLIDPALPSRLWTSEVTPIAVPGPLAAGGEIVHEGGAARDFVRWHLSGVEKHAAALQYRLETRIAVRGTNGLRPRIVHGAEKPDGLVDLEVTIEAAGAGPLQVRVRDDRVPPEVSLRLVWDAPGSPILLGARDSAWNIFEIEAVLANRLWVERSDG